MRHLGVWVVLGVVGVTSAAQAEELRIEDAVSLALSRNERAKISDQNVAVADAALRKAVAAFLPTLGVQGTYTQQPADVVKAGANTYKLLGQATLNQTVFNATLFPLLGQAKRNLDGQVSQTVDDKRLLAFDAARAFFQAMTADAVLAAASERLKTAQGNVDDAQQRLDAKLVGSNDLTRATIDLGNAVNELETDRGNERVAYQNLAFTINAPVPEKLARPAAVLEGGKATLPPIETLLRLAINRRPDLASKRYLAVGAHDFADEPLLRLVPTIGLSASFSLSSDPTLPPSGTFYNNEQVGVTITWPLFDGGVRYADKRSRDAQAAIADLTVDELLRTVDTQVRSATDVLIAAQAALAGAEKARTASIASVDETRDLYDHNLAKAIELVDANDSRFLAEVNYATAEYGVALAYLSLRQALGLDPLGAELR